MLTFVNILELLKFKVDSLIEIGSRVYYTIMSTSYLHNKI